jgi:DNA-directed RNA polymerase beta subunit
MGSSFGYICCNETPESLDVGITKYLSLFCLITTNLKKKDLINIYNFINKKENIDIKKKYKIFVDNIFVSFTHCDFLKKFKMFRQNNYNLKYVGIYSFKNIYYINTKGGRYIKPLLIKNKIKLINKKYNIKDYYINGILEYIDIYEFKNCILEETHTELDELSILGISASITPFLNNNQPTRITFQSGMVKQAITLNNKINNMSDIKVLIYGQVSICKTIINQLINFNTYGINVCIGVMPFLGYNQEDALIFKRSSIQKGIFSSYRYDLQEILIDKTIYECRILLKEGTDVKSDDKICSKYNIINKKEELINVKYNTTFHTNKIDKINIIDYNNQLIIRVLYRRYDTLNIGDKLSSRYSQKGVIGFIEEEDNLPYTNCGIIPDVYINPHSFPSRMTIGHILESTISIEGIIKNKFIDSTGFNSSKIDKLKFYKKQNVFNGKNSEIYKIYIGFCYYQQLKHQVIEKMYSMSKGPKNLITKQPINGKNNKGGLRLGELDKDCLLAHGSMSIIYEKFVISSDKYKMNYCKTCNNIINKDVICIFCNSSKIGYINTTYSFKLLCDLLKGLNINTLLN